MTHSGYNRYQRMQHTPYRRKRTRVAGRLKALEEAQKIAFAPMVFQAVNAMLGNGMLELISQGGSTRAGLAQKYGRYAVDVLVESTTSAGVVSEGGDGVLALTDVGECLLNDTMTQANFRFMADVCYHGAAALEESLREGRPAGLKVFGDWSTIYAGLSELPEPASTSWFRFDHFYSDVFFAEAIRCMQEAGDLRNVFDVGGNTGRFAKRLLATVAEAGVTIVDLPGQLDMARKNMGDEPRCHYAAVDVLTPAPWPSGASAIWMSQFLDCFSHGQIVGILTKAGMALAEGGSIFIAEPFLDRQNFPAAVFSLAQTSLYFTCMANGNSKMYTRDEMVQCVEEAGLTVANEWHGLGRHDYSLLQCRRK